MRYPPSFLRETVRQHSCAMTVKGVSLGALLDQAEPSSANSRIYWLAHAAAFWVSILQNS